MYKIFLVFLIQTKNNCLVLTLVIESLHKTIWFQEVFNFQKKFEKIIYWNLKSKLPYVWKRITVKIPHCIQ